MKRALGNLFLLALSVGMALLFSEFAVRIVAPQQLILIRPDIWLPVDTVGWIHRPGLDTRINTGERPARLMTDERSFRRGESSPAQANIEVLLIGDSFMAALQVDHEQTLAGLMEKGLAERFGQPVAVRNAGVGAWDASHYLLRARTLLAANRYDLLVVAVYVGNDVVSRRTERFLPVEPVSISRFRLPKKISKDEIIEAWLRPFNDKLETQSHLFVFVKNRLGALRMKLGLSAIYFPDGFRVDEANHPKWQVTLDIFTDLAQVAADRDTPILFLLLPANFQVDRRLFEQHVRALNFDASAVDLGQPNRILREGLRAKNLEVLDALPAFVAAFENGVRGFGLIDTHFNPDGHRIVWELSAEPMAEMLRRRTTRGEPLPAAR